MKWKKLQLILFLSALLASCSINKNGKSTIPLSLETPTLTSVATITPAPTDIPTSTPYAGLSNQLIAYQDEYLGEIFTAPLDGKYQIEITTSIPEYIYDWRWSPDGNWLLIASIKNKPSSYGTIIPNYITLWLVSADGLETHKIGNGYLENVVWSIDNTHLIFLENNEGGSFIGNQAYIFDLTNFERRVFLEGEITNGYAYFRDGSLFLQILKKMNGESTYYQNYEVIITPDGSIKEAQPSYYPTCGNSLFINKILHSKSDFIVQEIFCFSGYEKEVEEADVSETLIQKNDFSNRKESPSTTTFEYTVKSLIKKNHISLESLSPDDQWLLLSQYGDDYQTMDFLLLNTANGEKISISAYDPEWSPDSKNLIDLQKDVENNVGNVFTIDLSTLEWNEYPEMNWLAEKTELFQWHLQPNDPGNIPNLTDYLREGKYEEKILQYIETNLQQD